MPIVNKLPVAGTPVELKKVELKNVLVKSTKTTEDLTVEIIPFDRYNDAHVDFAYAYSDMLYRAPSKFRDINEASKAYARLFLLYTEEDEKNELSTFNKVCNDLRACRTVFNQDDNIKSLTDFFENA